MRKYPKYVLLHFDGNKHFIRVRIHGSKCFFPDGLKEFRMTHNLNESVILCFVSFDKNTTFSVDVVGPTHRQSRVKPVISTRRYIFTTNITQDMIQNNLPLVGFTALFFIYNSLSLFFFLPLPDHSFLIKLFDHPLCCSYRYFPQHLPDSSMVQRKLLPYSAAFQNAPSGTSPSIMKSQQLQNHGSTLFMKINWYLEMR